MAHKRISVSLDTTTIKAIDKNIKKHNCRSFSHATDYFILKGIEFLNTWKTGEQLKEKKI